MENNLSNLIAISRNKFNINLLETIEHKELFQNIKLNSIKSDSKIFLEYNESNINNDNQNKKVNYDHEKIKKKSLDKSKNNSKSFNEMMKIKLDNMQEIFNNYSPKKNKKFLTQNNSGKIKTNKKLKRNFSNSLNKRIKENKALLDHKINLTNFNFQRENHNLIANNKEYFSPSRNNDLKSNNSTYFNKSTKKEYTNNSKYSFNSNYNNLDVYNRLYNKSYYKKRNIEKEKSQEENNCTFNPILYSHMKQKKPNIEEINNFIKRQEKFNKYIKQKKINLKQDLCKNESKKYTFTPNTSCTSGSKYSIKLEAQRQDESRLDKTNRMVYDQIKKMEAKNNNLFLMYNNQFSFIPMINKNINIKKIKNPVIKHIPKNIKRNINTDKNENDIKRNQKYINHQYDNIKSNYKNDKELMTRIKEENKRRKKRIDNMRKERESSQFEGYTFKPDINKNNLSYMVNCNYNLNNNFYERGFERESSYTNNYNKRRNLQNRLNRSYSCYNKNNLYINSNINYNNFNNSKEPIYYNNTGYENDIYNYNDYNNYKINYNNCNNYFLENDINQNNTDYYNEYNIYNNQFNDFDENEEKYNDVEKRSLSMGNYRNNVNYMYMTPKCNKIYKSRAVNSIKKEDKQNFLLIHKLLYN